MLNIRRQLSMLLLGLCALLLPTAHPLPVAAVSSATLAYGLGVAEPDAATVLRMGFDWMAVYDLPNKRYPVNVLYRVPVNRWSLPTAPDEPSSFTRELYDTLLPRRDWIDAYEIGNEVNLYVNGWEGPPAAEAYVNLLCLAYQTIKSFDPTATVLSAGLAPVGRISGSWAGHEGHNYTSQDERHYLREFIAAGGLACVDAIGYHPNGFSARFDAPPDQDGGTPETNCTNGFCFRSIELIHQLLVAEGGALAKPIWATEVGWIAEPDNPACLTDGSWSGRAWQRVSRQQQADNLVGAFHYAEEHYPWLQGIFVFNLNFNQARYYHDCEQMRFYSVLEHEAYAALAALRPHLAQRLNYLPIIAGE